MLRFRHLLKKFETQGETELHSALERMYEEASKTWLSQLGEYGGSYTGVAHVENIESYLDEMVLKNLKESFSATEIFILLAAVLLHDIGKIELMNNSGTKKYSQHFHGRVSCVRIMSDYSELRIPNKGLAKKVAILACSHTWMKTKPNPKSCPKSLRDKCTFQCSNDFRELDIMLGIFGTPIRLNWLATLLRLSDEVDNCVSRCVPEYLEKTMSKAKSDMESSWRSNFSDIAFDPVGRCIRMKTPRVRVKDKLDRKQIKCVKSAMNKINQVLKGWSTPLGEMGLFFEEVFVEISSPVHALLDIDGLKSFEKNNTTHQCRMEPSLNEAFLEHIINAMWRLDRAVINKDLFSWESLAEESGIDEVKLVKLAANRIRQIDTVPQKFGTSGEKYFIEKKQYRRTLGLVCSELGWKLHAR